MSCLLSFFFSVLILDRGKVERAIKTHHPQIVVFDLNLDPNVVGGILDLAQRYGFSSKFMA